MGEHRTKCLLHAAVAKALDKRTTMVDGETGEDGCAATSGAAAFSEVRAAGQALDTARPIAALADPSSRRTAPTPEPSATARTPDDEAKP